MLGQQRHPACTGHRRGQVTFLTTHCCPSHETTESTLGDASLGLGPGGASLPAGARTCGCTQARVRARAGAVTPSRMSARAGHSVSVSTAAFPATTMQCLPSSPVPRCGPASASPLWRVGGLVPSWEGRREDQGASLHGACTQQLLYKCQSHLAAQRGGSGGHALSPGSLFAGGWCTLPGRAQEDPMFFLWPSLWLGEALTLGGRGWMRW